MTTDIIDTCDVAIVGAGAAGLATAAFLKRRQPSARVVLLEGARRPGAKILVSGGSRCNVTNAEVSERDFWGGSRASIRQVLRAFPVSETRAWFERLGVTLHEEPFGKLFPDTNRSRDVLEALLREVDSSGAVTRTGHRVNGIARVTEGFEIVTERGAVRAGRVVLATGGRALPKSGSDGFGYTLARHLGHRIVDQTPALAPLVLDASGAHAQLSGIACPVTLTVWIDGRAAERIDGPMLWTHFGVSGPAALNASRVWARARLEGHGATVTACLIPGATFETLDATLIDALRERPKAAIVNIVGAFVPAALAEATIAACEIAPDTHGGQVSRDARRRLTRAFSEWPVAVSETRGYTYAEATAGGVSLAEVDPRTMASRVCQGLYLVGEVLDVDGRLGGFNFQWAWSSAWVAAKGLARPF